MTQSPSGHAPHETAGAAHALERRIALRGALGFRLSRVARGLRQSWAEELCPLGTTPPQAAVLRGVSESPGCSLRALSRMLGTDPTNAKRCVDELEERGLLAGTERTGDRRPLRLTLTPAGEALVGAIDHLVATQEGQLAGALGPAGRRGLADALGRLEHLLGLEGDGPATRGDADHMEAT